MFAFKHYIQCVVNARYNAINKNKVITVLYYGKAFQHRRILIVFAKLVIILFIYRKS